MCQRLHKPCLSGDLRVLNDTHVWFWSIELNNRPQASKVNFGQKRCRLIFGNLRRFIKIWATGTMSDRNKSPVGVEDGNYLQTKQKCSLHPTLGLTYAGKRFLWNSQKFSIRLVENKCDWTLFPVCELASVTTRPLTRGFVTAVLQLQNDRSVVTRVSCSFRDEMSPGHLCKLLPECLKEGLF